ncbi:cation-transporting P-type ATPase [Iamia sp. SCSIO 61187]|nr:cation-transporting P-type ATPase [Iamia sp. SCSIO 61187]
MAGDAPGGAPGLTRAEAAARLRRDGANVLPTAATIPAWRRLVGQLVHFFALLLWAAAGLAVVAGMPQLGVAIVVVIVVNGVFAFVQEVRAGRAAEALRDLLPASVTVRRDGELTRVEASELVVGDAVVLAAGDRIPADLVVRHAPSATVDESMLTGESDPVPVEPGAAARAGTYLVTGEAEGEVVAVGGSTRLASLARLTADVERPASPLSRELDRVVRTVAVLAVGVGTTFLATSALFGTPLRDAFLLSIGVTVALVPEGLLPTVTLSLAIGAQRMARRDALVRHLEAVETLGATTFICTDKTGTLTRNEMGVVAVWTPAGAVDVRGEGYGPVAAVSGVPAARALAARAALAGRLASEGRAEERDGTWRPVGDPMEAAIDALARRLADDAADSPLVAAEVVTEHPFDADRRRESCLAGGWLLVKGAPDCVLPACTEVAGVDRVVDDLAARGLRVLAVAGRPARPGDEDEDATAHDLDRIEADLELFGLLALQDPPREEVEASLAICRQAGIKVAMLTGDHPTTARAIAAQVGLLGPEGLVLQGHDLPEDADALGEVLDHDGVVISRVTPEDKLRITTALQRRGHVVAMTGDGVNDAPALRKADIGVAMGRSGTDVARGAADLVLLDDDFATIVAAVEQGRATFANIRRFLTYHLTDNVAELTPFVIWALSGGSFPLALGVLQILCLDIGTDLLPSLALGAEPANPKVMHRPPERRHLVDGALLRRVFGVLGVTEATVEMAAFSVALAVASRWPAGPAPEGQALLAASGAAFAAVILGQMATAFACRSASLPVHRMGGTTNRPLLVAVAASLLALAGFLLIPPIAAVLDHAAPPAAGLAVALLAVPAVLAADTVHKARRARRRERRVAD